jgi:D-glycero-D-manno-heptose 1,7-bisphosphate phosphatase
MKPSAAGRPGVILDRDGTLIDFVRDPELGAVVSAFHPDQIRFLPGVLSGLTALSEGGFVLAIATNQPGAAKGQVPVSAIVRTNAALIDRLAEAGIHIDALEGCLHHPEGGPGGDPALVRPCSCRKPAPGMLTALAGRLGLDPARSWAIGDTASDVAAARAAGMRPALVFDPERCELCPLRYRPDKTTDPTADCSAPRFDLLAEAILAYARL